jgi:hypothetical protein
VGLAVTDMKMALRDVEWIVPPFSIQMDANHIDAPPRKVQVKLETPDQPAALLLFHLNMEGQPGIGPEFDFIARQFI